MSHIVVKKTVWERFHYNDKVDIQKIIKDLTECGEDSPYDILCDVENGYEYTEELYETEEYISPKENQAPTIEIFDDNDIQIWNNFGPM